MFGIPKAEREIFKRNFLKTAIFSLKYSTNKKLVDFKEDIKDIFKGCEVTPIMKGVGLQIKFEGGKQVVESVKGSDEIIGFDFKLPNDDLHINIQQGNLSLKINSEKYLGFDSLLEYLPKINKFFELLDVKSYGNLSIRKINVLELEKTEAVKEPAQVLLKTFINKRLLGDISYFGDSDYVSSNINSLIFNDGDDTLNLRYGMNSPKGFSSDIRHILIDIESTSKKNSDLEKLEGDLTFINQHIYNTFIWVISDTFKKILNDERIDEV